MPFYYELAKNLPDRKRVAATMLRLRTSLDKEIPARTVTDSLLLGTWNLRAFAKPGRGGRTGESFLYIAEIISRFDLVALQEVREDLGALKHLTGLLGPWWKYIVTDTTEGSEGNYERLAFVYDSRKVRFGGLAGEVVLPPVKLPDGGRQPVRQLARTPFLVGFEAGWFSFMLCTVHILYGKGVADHPGRLAEIQAIANHLAKRAADRRSWSNNMLLLGDFNIFDNSQKTYKALGDAGFTVPKGLNQVPTNTGVDARYFDQIAYNVKDARFAIRQSGVYNLFQVVYRDADFSTYRKLAGRKITHKSNGALRTEAEQRAYFRQTYRTFQMSDHLPLWAELKIEFGGDYLKDIAG